MTQQPNGLFYGHQSLEQNQGGPATSVVAEASRTEAVTVARGFHAPETATARGGACGGFW